VAKVYIIYYCPNVQRALFEEDYEKHAESSVSAMTEFNESMRSLEKSSRGQLESEQQTAATFPRSDKYNF
jgi:hypothetical protein